jgi:hypothetical protein
MFGSCWIESGVDRIELTHRVGSIIVNPNLSIITERTINYVSNGICKYLISVNNVLHKLILGVFVIYLVIIGKHLTIMLKIYI